MAQLVDMLGDPAGGQQAGTASLAEINTLGEYGLHLIDELADQARQVKQSELAVEAEGLALPFALWIARNDGEIRNLKSVVNALAHYAGQAHQPQSMATLYTHCCEIIEAASPACEETCLSDGRHPWRLLLLNRAVVATRSLNPELMTAAYDAIVEQLPDEAKGFFAEGMEQMAVADYPDQVRDLVKRYYLANAAPRRLH